MSSIIEELGTRITTNCNTDELEGYKGIFDSYDEVVDRIVSKLKSDEVTITKEVAETLQNNQRIISQQRSFNTGEMANSIMIEEQGNTAIVGTTARSSDGFPYPLSVEFGRKEVVPIRAKVLRWINEDGMTVFSKYSSAVAPRPFVEPSINETLNQVEDIVNKVISL